MSIPKKSYCHVLPSPYHSRNDDLYKATTPKSTTSSSVVPLIDRGFYNRTRHSFLNGGHSNAAQQNNNSPSTVSPSQSNNNNNDTPNRSSPNGGKNNNRPNVNNQSDDQRPLRPLRRPIYRRRPVAEYYYDDEYPDEFYDERMRRRNRPRNRRPVYDDYDSRRL